ncbi:MAG: FG-GAP-like repeat-containing protein, partial [Candidatus Roizmanbacteria bacterium]|nr:FG-GAP-like repeat-containing protein [Candidatus Roizmanbacteria bacterium]
MSKKIFCVLIIAVFYLLIIPTPVEASFSVTQETSFTGNAAGDNLHYIATGDVNGDGIEDLALLTTAGNGKVYIFFGETNLDTKSLNNADVVLSGESGAKLTSSISLVDVNGDGYDDILIGSASYNSYQGRVYIFLGGHSLSNKSSSQADYVLTGNAPLDGFGMSVSAADVNGDGYNDIVVGAPMYPNLDTQGQVFLFLGGPSLSNKSAGQADAVFTGEQPFDWFGMGNAKFADLDNDGYKDIVVSGQNSTCNSCTVKGKVYVFKGGKTITSKPAASADYILTGELAPDGFGASFDVGDFNGDEIQDLLAGSASYPAHGDKGRAYVFYGGSGFT